MAPMMAEPATYARKIFTGVTGYSLENHFVAIAKSMIKIPLKNHHKAVLPMGRLHHWRTDDIVISKNEN